MGAVARLTGAAELMAARAATEKIVDFILNVTVRNGSIERIKLRCGSENVVEVVSHCSAPPSADPHDSYTTIPHCTQSIVYHKPLILHCSSQSAASASALPFQITSPITPNNGGSTTRALSNPQRSHDTSCGLLAAPNPQGLSSSCAQKGNL